MPSYAIFGHPLLSTAASEVHSDVLDSNTDQAEALLRLDGTTFTDATELAQAELAIVLQVNQQVMNADFNPQVEEERKSRQTIRYRSGSVTAVNPTARRLAEGLVGKAEPGAGTATLAPRFSFPVDARVDAADA